MFWKGVVKWAHRRFTAAQAMHAFWSCFVPLFVAVDAIGTLPMFILLTQGLDAAQLRRVVLQSVATALLIAWTFLLIGPLLLAFLGITVADFMIAGGLLLLVLSLRDLLAEGRRRVPVDVESLGAVPIGIPLIAGPAVLTTCILLAHTHGKSLTALGVTLNILLSGVLFSFGTPITRRIGRTGTRTFSKIASMLLTAFAVMLIRRGLMDVGAIFVR